MFGANYYGQNYYGQCYQGETVPTNYTKTVTDTISPVEIFFIGYLRFKILIDTITPIENYFMRLNGGLIRWLKIRKSITIWSKIAKTILQSG